MKVDNAIILAAGTASRFAPLSYEIPKGLVEVKGEVLTGLLLFFKCVGQTRQFLKKND